MSLETSELSLGGTLYLLVTTGAPTPGARPVDTSALYLTFQVVRGVQSLLAVAGNLLTVVSVLRYRALRTGTNYLVASLAVADLLSGVNFLAFIPLVYTPDPTLWRTLCVLNQSVALVVTLGNLVHMAVIAGDRYIAVRAGLSYSRVVTPRRAGVCVALLWLVLVFGFGPIVGLTYDVTGYEDVCTYIRITPHKLLIVTALPCGLLSSLTALTLYLLIAVALRKQARRMSHAAEVADDAFPQRLAAPHRRSDVERKVTKVMGLVGLAFVVFTLPALVFSAVLPAVAPSPAPWMTHAYRAVIVLAYCSSFTNPIIYAWMNRRFSAAFRALLRGRCSSRAVGKLSVTAPVVHVQSDGMT